MKILIITNEIPPMTNANSMIANNLAVGFSNNPSIKKIDLISILIQEKKSYCNDKINYIKTNGNFFDKKFFEKKNKISHSKTTQKILYSIFNPKLLFYYTIKKSGLRDYLFVKKIKEMNKLCQYNFVIAVSSPINTVKAVIKSRIDTKIVWYQLDPFFDHYRYLKNNHKRYKTEIKLIKSSSMVLIPEWNYKDYINNFPTNYHKKIYEIGLPLDITCEKKIGLSSIDNFNMVFTYTGAFYDDIRKPDEMLNFLDLLFKDNNYIFVYAGPSYYIIERYLNSNNLNNLESKMLNLGMIDSCQVNNLILSSNVLINVDNLTSNQVPSKLIQYMFTNKTILNFESDYSNYSKQLFQKYSNHYVVKKNDNLSEIAKDFNKKLLYLSTKKNNSENILRVHTFKYISNLILKNITT